MAHSPKTRIWQLALCALILALSSSAAFGQATFNIQFNPNTIGPGSVSTMQFSITNNVATPLTGLNFSNFLPASVTIADPTAASTTCLDGVVGATAGGTTISLTDGRLGSFQTCFVFVDVTSSTPGTHTNGSTILFFNELAGDPPSSSSVDLTVGTDRPGFSKSFAPDSVSLGGRSTLTLTIDNSLNASALSSLVFTDNLPVGMEIANPANAVTTCGGANPQLTAISGTTTVAFQSFGLLFPGFEVMLAGETCTVVVDVVGTTNGMLDNVTTDLTSNVGSSGKASDTLDVTVTPLAIRKSFTDDPVRPGSNVTLEFRIDNFDRTSTATDVAFTDDLTALVPAIPGLTFDSVLNDDCGGTVTGVGGTLISMTGGTIAAQGSCTLRVSLSVPIGTPAGAYLNTTSMVTGMIGGSAETGNAASEELFVVPAPLVTKTFLTNPVNPGDTVELEFTVTNVSSLSGATDITFRDLFDPIHPTASVTPANGCCGAGSTCMFTPLVNPPPPSDIIPATLTISGGTLAAAGMADDSCTFSITLDVTGDAAPGLYPNTTTDISATVEGGTQTNSGASDTLTVISAPTLSKEFTDDPTAPGGTVTLDFTLTYPADATGDATDIEFTDDLAATVAGLTATGLPLTAACDPDGPGGDPGTGTLTASVGDTFLEFSGGTLSPGESCTFSVTLAVDAAAIAGTYTNTTSGVSATVGGVTAVSAAAVDDLIITGLIFTKEFVGDPALPGETVRMIFRLQNISPNATDDASSISFNDDLSFVLPGVPDLVPSLPEAVNTCGGVLTPITPLFLFYSGGTLPIGSSCTIEIDVTIPSGTADGTYVNTTSNLTAIVNGSLVVLPPATGPLVVDSTRLSLIKEFTDDPVAAGDPVTLEFTLANLDIENAVSSIAFTDDLDLVISGMTFDSVLFDDCGGTVTGTGSTDINVSDVSLAAGGSCTLRVSLTVPAATTAGFYTNTTSGVTGLLSLFPVVGVAASDNLEVIELLDFSKSFDGPTTATGTAILTFTITNPGASPASDIEFTDDLDAVISGMTATSLPTEPCGTLSSISGTSLLAFSGGELAALGGSCTFDVEVTVPVTATGGTFLNTTSDLTRAGLKVSEPATANLTIEPAPTFAKAFSPDTILAGGTSTLTFTIDNSASTLAASDLAFVDNLPTGVVITTPAVTSNTCGGTLTAAAGGGSISLSGTGSVGAGATCTISVDVTSDAEGSYDNLTEDLTSSSGNSGTAADTLTVTAATDLSITKTDGVTSATPGGSVTYTIVVTNGGPSDDPSVSVADTFPADLTCTYTSSAAGGATGNTAMGSGDIADTLSMPASSSVTYTATCDIDSAATGTLSNTATVTASITDTDAGNDSATDNDTALTASADVSVTKTDGVTSAVPGQDLITYTIVVTNNGPSDDPSVSVADTFPADLTCTYTSVATRGATGNTASGSGDIADTLSMTAGSSVTYTATCMIDSGATGTLSNTATVSASVSDPDTSNDSATDDDTVLSPEADVQITKTDGVTSAVPGQDTVTYTIEVTNNGPSDDPSVSVADTFPADLTCTYTSVAADGATGNTAAGSGDINDTLSMPLESSVIYTATCDIDSAATGTLSNTATATASVTDTDTGNNSATDNDTALTPEADVQITKTDGVTSATPGGSVTYTIIATNVGPSDDPSVSVADTFPADLTCTYTSVAAGGATGNTAAGSGDIADTLSMPAGSSVTYTATCDIDSAATGTLSNTATATASVTDPDSSNDSATDNDTVLSAEADVQITKTDGVTSATPGGSVTYTIVVSNAGLSDDPSVSVADTFPADLTCTYTSVAAGGATGNTAAGSGDIADTLSMPSGSSVTYTATCDIAADATGTLSNTATATASVTDPDTGNNSATDDDTALEAEADLQITKTDGVTSATPGGSVTYTLVVTNNGASDDPSVAVADTFPADLTCTYSSVAAGGATGNTAAGSGDIADTLSMPAGSSVTYTATCDIDSAATGTLSNTATVTASVTDPDTSNNSATDNDTALNAEADVSITKTDGVTSATAGGSVTYTIVVSNAGLSDDPSVSVADTFPADLTCTYTSVAAGGATGNTSGSGDIADTLSMPAGSSVTYTATCDIDSGATGTLSNTATATASVTDPDTSNNSATDDDTVLNVEADVEITKTDNVTEATPGESVTYEIVVTNNGPSDDPSVDVADTFPADLTCSYTSVAAGGATGNTSGSGDIADTLSMPAGSSVTYTATCDIDSAATGTLSNTATATASVTDPDTANNSATDDDTVLEAEADVQITKTDNATEATPGESVTYEIVVTNDGPSDDPSVDVADTFPAGLTCTYTSVASGGATGNTSGSGDIADTLSMPAGSSVTYTAVCDIDTNTTGTLSNTATATASVDDPDTSNNSATDETVLAALADLQITKTDGVEEAIPGESVTYTIVASNPGPSEDPAAEVGDVLPPELTCTWTSVAAGGATGNTPAGAGNISDILSMPVGSSVAYTAVCDIDPDAVGILQNTARIAGSTGDPNPENNGATDSTTLISESDLAIVKTGPETVTIGEQLTYTLTVVNNGPSVATDVTLDDPTPAGLEFVSATTPCEGGFPCDLGTLGVGEEVTVEATFEVPFEYEGADPLVNTATVTSIAVDENPENNSSSVETDVNFDLVPPKVKSVETELGQLDVCDNLRVPIDFLRVTIEDDMAPIEGADDPANYLVLEAGPDGDFSTTDCDGPAGDDEVVEITDLSVATAPNGVVVDLGFSSVLPSGLYRLLVCDGITDAPGNALDGDGDETAGGNFVLSFFRADPLNLFDNGHFDDCPVTLAPWVLMATEPNTITPGTPGADDFEGSPLSASALVAHSADFTSSLAQCVNVEEGRNYELQAQYRFEPPMGATALLEQTCEWFDDFFCLGNSLGSDSVSTLLEDEGGDWQGIVAGLTAPRAAVSALCDHVIDPLTEDPNFDVYLDALSLLAKDNLIFGDGFESGDTSAWSATTP